VLERTISKNRADHQENRKPRTEAAVRCYECDDRGHFARECPTRLRKEKKLSDSPSRKNPSERSKCSHAPGEKQGNAISGNECRVLTVFTPGKGGHSPQPMRQTEETKEERVLESPKIEEPTSQSRTWLVKALENLVLAPRCKQVAVARLETEKAQNLPPLLYVEPAQIPIEGIFPARTLSRVKPSTRQSSQLTQPSNETVTRSANTAYVMLAKKR